MPTHTIRENHGTTGQSLITRDELPFKSSVVPSITGQLEGDLAAGAAIGRLFKRIRAILLRSTIFKSYLEGFTSFF